jgi:O-6-methylguanine DNA methyltransferase
MPDPCVFDQLHLNDAQRLRQAGFLPASLANQAAMREYLHRVLALCGGQVYIVSDAQAAILAVAGYQKLDLAGQRTMLHLQNGEAPWSAPCLQAILDKAFQDLDIFRLEVGALPEDQLLQTVLGEVGMQFEGMSRGSQFDEDTKRHHDMMLYSILRPVRPGHGTAFIPFAKGVFAVTGNNEYVSESCLLHYGDALTQQDFREAAEQLGLLDERGRMAGHTEFHVLTKGERYVCVASTPEIVRQAAAQIVDYFAGRRPNFDIPLDLSQGSTFQVKVWRLLAEIPYGSTWTYEELAHKLAGSDWAAARKLARAVGSACSANPLPLILPCHRVIGKDGRLVGFSSGLDMKEYLLMHEMMATHEA